MPKDNGERAEMAGMSCCSCLAVLLATAAVIICSLALSSEWLWPIDQVVSQIDDGLTSHSNITIQTNLLVLLIVSVFIVVFGIAGVCGALCENRFLVPVFVIASLALATVLFSFASVAVVKVGELEPIVTAEVNDLCNATTHQRLSMNLGCDWAISSGAEVPNCGAVCQERVEEWRDYSGCEVLRTLCTDFVYQSLGVSPCFPGNPNASVYSSSLLDSECRTACNDGLGCGGYLSKAAAGVMPNECLIVGEPLRTQHWTLAASGDDAHEYLANLNGYQCWNKAEPIVLDEFLTLIGWVTWTMIVLSIVLFVGLCCSCCLVYTMNFRRQGKPSAKNLCLLLFCPCCAGDAGLGYTEFDADLLEPRDEEFGDNYSESSD